MFEKPFSPEARPPAEPLSISEIDRQAREKLLQIKEYSAKVREFLSQISQQKPAIQNDEALKIIESDMDKLELFLQEFDKITSPENRLEPAYDENGIYQITIQYTGADGQKIPEQTPALKRIVKPQSEKEAKGYPKRLNTTLAHILNNQIGGIHGLLELLSDKYTFSIKELEETLPKIVP